MHIYTYIYIIYTQAREGSLDDLLTKCVNNELSKLPSWAFRIRVAAELAEALKCLHENGLIHRDVKAANVLFDNAFHVKLCDYGLAVGCESEARLTFVGGTEQFMAPEMILADYGRSRYFDCYCVCVCVDILYVYIILFVESICR
jgi:serine/threonine protein kinase